MAQFDESGIDPVKYGVLWQKVQDYERRFDDMDKKMDKMESNLEKLVALANQGRGGFWAGMAFVSFISSAVGFALSWLKGIDMNEQLHQIEMIKAQARVELSKMEAASPAKDVAGRAIGKHGLFYITLIVAIGVASSLVLDKDKIAAVMGLLGASLTALISMLNGIAGANAKQEKPEFEVMKQLIDKLDKLDRKEAPMKVTVEGEKVTVSKGDDTITTSKG